MPSSFSPAANVTAMTAVLEAITGIGKVYGRRKVFKDEASVKRLMFDADQNRICGWMISPSPTNFLVATRNPGFNAKGAAGGGQVLNTYQWQIEGYFSLLDEQDSETLFRDLTTLVADTFNSFGLLDIPGVVMQLPCGIEVFGYTMLAQMFFLHYARLSIGFTGQRVP